LPDPAGDENSILDIQGAPDGAGRHRLEWAFNLTKRRLDNPVHAEHPVDRPQKKGRVFMATYIVLLHYTDQGIRNIKDTTKRATAASDVAGKMGVKFTELFWTLGHYDLAIVAEAPDDETMTAVMLKLASLGNVKSQTLRAYRSKEIEAILKKAA
jgi:uncharacterized protein with GYD domain